MSENLTHEHRIPSRRAVVGAAALTVPAVVLAVTSPAHAGSDPGSVTLTFSSTLVRSGEAVNVTIVRKDALGQPLAGQSVTLSGTSGAWQFAARSGTTDANGVFRTQAIATGHADATATATVTATGSGGTATASTTVTFARRVLSVSVSPTSVAPGGKATVTVKVTDNAGKSWAGQSVSASASGGATLAASSGTTSYYGVWTTQITAPAASGSSTITAAYRDSDQNLTATATLTIS